MVKELVMYSRTWGCPFITVAKHVLNDYGVAYREIMIDTDKAARERVLQWTGFLSVPTLVIARPGEVLPYEAPALLEAGRSPRGIHRDTMITEPNADQLLQWLVEHGFIDRV
jgi:glutaredoxin